MRPGFETTVPHFPNVSANPWLPDYPNPPDLRFNYYKLMNDAWANNSPIAKAPAGKTVKRNVVSLTSTWLNCGKPCRCFGNVQGPAPSWPTRASVQD